MPPLIFRYDLVSYIVFHKNKFYIHVFQLLNLNIFLCLLQNSSSKEELYNLKVTTIIFLLNFHILILIILITSSFNMAYQLVWAIEILTHSVSNYLYPVVYKQVFQRKNKDTSSTVFKIGS